MPTLEQHHLGLGRWTVVLEPDPQLVELLTDFTHIRLRHNGRAISLGPIMERHPGEQALVISGPSIERHLGVDTSVPGPLIGKRRIFSGHNKLSNPDFGTGDLLYWRWVEDTVWNVIVDGAGFAAQVSADPEENADVLTSETFEAEPADRMRAQATVRRDSGTLGRVRVRLVYEGDFDHPNLVSSVFAGFTLDNNMSLAGGVLTIGPIPHLALIANPSFEPGLAGWVGIDSPDTSWTRTNGDAHDGSWSVKRQGSVNPFAAIVFGTDSLPLVAGARYRFRAIAKATTDMNSDLTAELADVDKVSLGSWRPNPNESAWVIEEKDVSVPDDWTDAVLNITNTQPEAGGMPGSAAWWVDNVQLWQTSNLHRTATGPTFDVLPGRTYRALASVSHDATVSDGKVALIVKLTGPGRDPITQEATQGIIEEATAIIDLRVRVPSGYDTAQVLVRGTDIFGGTFQVRSLSLVDDDASTWAAETVSAETSGETTLAVEADAPDGTTHVRLELHADANSGGWVVTNADLRFVNVTIPTLAQVISNLLIHPDTGLPILPEGVIEGDDPLDYDVTIRNLMLREALRYIAQQGPASTPREWRTDPETGALSFGLPEDLFEDRVDVVIEDAEPLTETPSAETTVEDYATHSKVIGAERDIAPKVKRLITGEATNPDQGYLDWMGNPLHVTRLIQDSSIDHPDQATARAQEEAARDDDARENISLKLSDTTPWWNFDQGDWIYVYVPGVLEDPNNPVASQEGGTIFPRKVRVMSRAPLTLGDRSCTVEHIAADGTVTDISDHVRYEGPTETTIEVGDSLPDFIGDAQGGGAFAQFQRWREAQTR